MGKIGKKWQKNLHNFPLVFPSGAVGCGGSTKGGSFGEAAVQQPPPTAVAVLGGDPLAAQNVAGSSQHALQPATAALPTKLSSTILSQEGSTDTHIKEQTTTDIHRNGKTKDSSTEELSLDTDTDHFQRGLPACLSKDSSSCAYSQAGPIPDRLVDTQKDIAQSTNILHRSDTDCQSNRQKGWAERGSSRSDQEETLQVGTSGGPEGEIRGRGQKVTEKAESVYRLDIADPEELGQGDPNGKVPLHFSQSSSISFPVAISRAGKHQKEPKNMDHSQTTRHTQTNEASLPQSDCLEGKVVRPESKTLTPLSSSSDSLHVTQVEPSVEPKCRPQTMDCSDKEKHRAHQEVDGVGKQLPEARHRESEQFTVAVKSEHREIGEHSLCHTQTPKPGGSCTEGPPPVLQAEVHGTPKPTDLPFKPDHLSGNGDQLPSYTTGKSERSSSSQKDASYLAVPTGKDTMYKETDKKLSSSSVPSGDIMQEGLTSENRTSSPSTLLQNTMDISVQFNVPYLNEVSEPGLQENPVALERAEPILSEQECFVDENIMVSELLDPSGTHEIELAGQTMKNVECPEVEANQHHLVTGDLQSNASTVAKEPLLNFAGDPRLEKGEGYSQGARVMNTSGGAQDSKVCLQEMGKENHASMVQVFPLPHYEQNLNKSPKTPGKCKPGEELDNKQQLPPQSRNIKNDSCTQLEQGPPLQHLSLCTVEDGGKIINTEVSNCPPSCLVSKTAEDQGKSQDLANTNTELTERLTESNVIHASLDPAMCIQTTATVGQLTKGDEQLAENETKEHVDKIASLVDSEGKGSSLQTGVVEALQKKPITLGYKGTTHHIEVWTPKAATEQSKEASPPSANEIDSPLPSPEKEIEVVKKPLTASPVDEAKTCPSVEAGQKGICFPDVFSISEGKLSSTTSFSGEVPSKGPVLNLQSVEHHPHADLPLSIQGKNQDLACNSCPVLTDPAVLMPNVAIMEKNKGHESHVIQRTEDIHKFMPCDHALSSSNVDPKLLILNLADAPLDKHPSNLLGRLSSNLEVLHLPGTQTSSPICESSRVSDECLSKTGLPTDLVPEKSPTCSDEVNIGPPNHSEPVSSCLQSPLTQRSLASSTLKQAQSISDLETLAEVRASPGSTCTVSQNPDMCTMAAPIPLSVTALPLLESNVLGSLDTRLDSDAMLTEVSLSTQPFTDVESEQLECRAVPQLSVSDTQSLALERENTTRSENSDSEPELSGKSQATGSRFASHSSAQNKTDRTFAPLRGPHGKFISPPARSLGGPHPSDPATTNRPRAERPTDMAELAKHEAEIEHRSLALKREGFWSLKRLSRVAEPGRTKVHWDYLCEEMQWLSADFAQERRWKRGVARKVVRMVMRHHEEQRQKEEKAKREEQAKLRRVASSIAKEVRAFWSSVEKVVQFKQQSRLEEKRKKALDLQLDFIVGQTERYSDLLSQSLSEANVTVPPTSTLLANPEAGSSAPKGLQPHLADEDDGDFEPLCEEEDDEETIEVEEQQEGNDAETHRREIELLQHEGTLPLDQLLHTLTQTQDIPDEDESSEDSSSDTEEEEDEEFTANEDDAEDEEETIAAQEVVEGDADHSEELGDLAREGEMSLDDLLEKYRGAYSEDFEMPSASDSPTSSEGSVSSADQEEDSEGDDSDAQSSTSSDDSAAIESDDEGEEGMEILLKGGDRSPPGPAAPRPKKEISHIAATAESLQPKGYTLATTQVKTPIPFLLHGTLREYQHIGLDWLVTMYEKKLNGILADEMGLGKTIQTIALLAHLACEKGNWGPHLIIVPTSVMLNWEMELKRWCPGFKILTYYGSQKERKLKRQGWTKPNAFHVCITSYKLVLQDHQAFRRKSWRYLILDEAQNIKNFKSQRWQSLLNFNSQRRLLLTGTPLQNSLMELWSLMHFLMPHVFQSHREFKEWFSNPLTGMIEGSQEYNEGLVKRLHKVLRPFLLRRIKADVEKQMPKKYEHVVRCRLSKRQRFLYDDFMAQASTRETLASGHFMSVINILMQLRKVCNHPNLFDPRPIHSPFITAPILFSTASIVLQALENSPFKCCDLSMFDLLGLEGRVSRYQADVFLPRRKITPRLVQEIMDSPDPPPRPKPVRMKVNRMFQPLPKADGRTVLLVNNPRPPCPDQGTPPAPRPPVGQDTAPSAPAGPPVTQVTVSTVPPSTQPPPPASPNIQATAVCAGSGTAVRHGAPVPVMAVRPASASSATTLPAFTPPPSSTMTQRVLLSPDMQARLPSGEVVSIAQLASLAGRPVSSCQGSKPVTFQLQGNKLTLSGAQLHQVAMTQPRPVHGNVVHLLSSGGQHHLISQPTQVAVIQTVSQGGGSTVNTHPATAPSGPPLALPLNTAQVPSSMVTSPGIVKIVVRQSTGKEGGAVPALAVPPPPRVPTAPPPASPAFAPHAYTSSTFKPPVPIQPSSCNTALPRAPTSASTQPHLTRPILRVLPGPAVNTEQANQAKQFNSSDSVEEVKEVGSSVQKGLLSTSSGREDSSDVLTLRMAAPPSYRSFSLGHDSSRARAQPPPPPRSPFYMSWLADRRKAQREDRLNRILLVNERHCSAKPVYGREVLDFLTFLPGIEPAPPTSKNWGHAGRTHCLYSQSQAAGSYWEQSEALRAAIHSTEERLHLLSDIIDRYIFVIPPVEAPPITMHSCHPPPWLNHQHMVFSSAMASKLTPLTTSLHRIQCNMRTHFPDLRLIQYDCGKLQTLHSLLRRLKAEGHRVLIFTQMTRMLDVLEQFLNYHGHIYLRLDGSTRVEQRQALMERFNADRRIFCFILSTRSGGVGVNLTGADTVVFYDSDWNPTMDAQAQDRCHRIGQTRDVHIYRLISERTVEENILKKANQKRMLGDMAIEGGNFTTAFFKQQTIRELFDVSEGEKKEAEVSMPPRLEDEDALNKQHTTILEQALCRAEDEEDIVAASQAKAEQVAELAEFNESIPFEEGGEAVTREQQQQQQQEEEELSKAEQEIAALVEQLTPIERYAMNFLEASLEDVCKEELKQAEEQVEAARKGLDQAKEEGLKFPPTSDSDDEESCALPCAEETLHPTTNRRPRKHKEKGTPSTRTSGRLRGATVASSGDPHLSPACAQNEQDKEKGTEIINLDADLASGPLIHSSTHQQCHHSGPVSIKPKKENPTLEPVVLREVPDSSYSALQGRETTKDFSASTKPPPAHTEQAQAISPFSRVLEPSSTSNLISQSQSISSPTSPLPPSSIVPSSGCTPINVNLNTLKAASTSFPHSLSGEECKDPSQDSHSDAPEVLMETVPLNDQTEQGGFRATVSAKSGFMQTPVSSPVSPCVSLHDQHCDSGTPHMINTSQVQQTQQVIAQPTHTTVIANLSRSPRKRQSADGEVLSGLPEDSPSAKVLRKLPGRLVTVVEDKEPKKRKRGASGGGGSGSGLSDGNAQINRTKDEPATEMAPLTPDRADNTTATQMSPSAISPRLHLAQNSPPYLSGASGVPPYSPTHHSPDMPVLRNLPVRRRLETESRMAAQLGEQQMGKGRGRGERRASLSPNFPRKKDVKLEESKDCLSSLQTDTSASPNVNTTSPGKRKRGRPPKTPPRLIDCPAEQVSPPLVVEIERTGSVEGSPSSSPKRKRGRPRKHSAKMSEPTLVRQVDMDCPSSLPPYSLSPHSERATPKVDMHSCTTDPVSVSTPHISGAFQREGSAISQAPISALFTSGPSQGLIKNEAEPAQAEKSDQGRTDTNPTSEGKKPDGAEDKESTKQEDGEDTEREHGEEEGLDEQEGSTQPKKRRVVTCMPRTQESVSPAPSPTYRETHTALQSEKADSPEEDDRARTREKRHSTQKRPSSRQSSQESARSSSPLSVSSYSTSVQSTHDKNEGSVMSIKMKQEEVNTNREEGETTAGMPDLLHTSTQSACCPKPFSVPPRHSSSSSDSDESDRGRKERRLTRAAQKKLERTGGAGETEVEKDGDNSRSKRSTKSPDRVARAESSSNVSVRVTRKSSGPQPYPECRSQSTALPEVLGKRCSALNAAAKLLAMRSRGGNEGTSARGGLDRGGKAGGPCRVPGSVAETKKKMLGRVSGEMNSSTNKAETSRQAQDPSPTASRSTRQRPGYLVPPLETETKRGKKQVRKAAKKEREEGGSGSPRGHSTSSSASSEGGEGSSRSRSSSMSSHHTHSLSSQSTGPLCSHSRAPSSCSDQERGQEDRDQSGKKRDKRERADRGRKSRKERWRHQESDLVSSSQSRVAEVSTGSSEGTPDRVLRSVAALAAAQARTPASNTRSSTTHHHQQQPHAHRTKT